MAQCNFSIDFSDPIEQLIEKAKDAVTSNGGAFNGNTQSGDYSIPTPVGDIEGTYTVTGNAINFEITKKPFLVSCKKIEDELKEKINSTESNLMNFDI